MGENFKLTSISIVSYPLYHFFTFEPLENFLGFSKLILSRNCSPPPLLDNYHDGGGLVEKFRFQLKIIQHWNACWNKMLAI